MKAALATMWCAAAMASGSMAVAQESYPTKPITMIVPAAPGGAADIIARAISTGMAERLGQSVLIDNRGGASGVIGTEFAARAAPDGYTILMSPPPGAVIVPHYRKVPYDTLKDFAPVTLIVTSPQIVVVNPSVPVDNIKELLALARKDPKALSYGSAGYGAPSSLAGTIFNKLTGAKIAEVPYKGAGPAMAELLGNHIQMMFAPMTVALPYIKDGRIKALAVTAARRLKAVPDVPTLIESGVDVDVASFYGVLAPAGTPQPIVDKLRTTIVEVLKEPKVQAFFEGSGAEIGGNTPQEFKTYIADQYVQYGQLLKEAGITGPKK